MINPPWPETWSEAPVALAMSPIPLDLNRSEPAPEMRLRFAVLGEKLAALGG